MNDKVVVGIDVGYGKCKVCVDRGGSRESFSFRSLAALASGGDLGAGVLSARNTERVIVDGTDYEVGDGVNSLNENNVSHVLHDDYIQTPEYMALVYACLARAKVGRVDMLVTGLPVSHFEKKRTSLQTKLIGTHEITNNRRVQIREAQVIPQPLGGTLEYDARITQNGGENNLRDLSMLVLDIGQYTFDWLVIRQFRVDRQLCDSHSHGMYSVLSNIHDALFAAYNGAPDILNIAEKLENNDPFIHASGNKARLDDFVPNAVKPVADRCLRALQNNLQSATNRIDRVLLVGGGARLFKSSVEAFFTSKGHKNVPIVVSHAAGFANVQGYVLFGLGVLARGQQQAG